MGDNNILPYPYEFRDISDEEKSLLNKLHTYPDASNSARVGPKGYIVNKAFKKDAANIYSMPLRPSDIFVTSYQRSGTTWTQELVWLLASDLDYEKALAVPLTERYSFLEMFMFVPDAGLESFIKTVSTNSENFNKEKMMGLVNWLGTPVSRALATTPSPRFIKSHLPMSLLPPKLLDTAKMVYIARDPRDVVVSYYHHTRLFMLTGFNGTFKEFWHLFHQSLCKTGGWRDYFDEEMTKQAKQWIEDNLKDTDLRFPLNK
ncbi:hypothetical protein HF086_017895 [Spodoptera exigua]|uniref:Sulfotransferase domain-containing protein n=1 Tax=Spodoptera exigua TaxID=7107 RepID=A0A922SFN0_SPOEX|nr:hypothetical protein HF086_017895 [Spodoptera exigua]